jgi:alpha/beta superfamily hydrolase
MQPEIDEQLISGLAGTLQVRAMWQPSDRVAVICHPHPLFGGTMDNKVVSTLARFFKNQQISVVIFNFRGVGASTGAHDQGVGEIDDVFSVLNWVATQTDARNLYLAGFSFGAYIAAAVASQFNQGRVAAELSHFYLQKTFLIAPPVHHYPMNDLNLKKDTLVVIGEQDEIVPSQQVVEWAKQLNLKIATIAACSHFFHGHLTDLTAQLQANYQ